MVSRDEIVKIWGGEPSADERKAFLELWRAYSADENQYAAYEAEYIRQENHNPLEEGQRLSALNYGDPCGDDIHEGCSTIGTNTKEGHTAGAGIPDTYHDGWHQCTHDQTVAEPGTAWPMTIVYGHSYIMVADEGTELPESEELPSAEPNVTAQNLGYHEYKAWFVFGALGVPKDAIINYAEIKLVASNDLGTGEDPLPTWIKAEKTVNPQPPPYTPFGTPAIGWWNDKVWTDNWADFTAQDYALDEVYYTSNIACVIQELCEQEGWTTSKGALLVIDPQPLDYGTGINYGMRWAYDFSEQPGSTYLSIWYSIRHRETGSGGAKVGGSADVGGHWIHTAQDGFEFNGVARVGGTITEFVGGGVKVNGGATYGMVWRDTNEAGIRFGGAAGGDAWFVTSGGVKAGGEAAIQMHWYEEMTDGFVIANPTFDNGYGYRLKFRVPAGQVAADIEKFYLFLSTELDPTETDGTNYLVTDDSTNQLASELVRYNASNGRVSLVVKTPLRADTTNDFWLYYKQSQ